MAAENTSPERRENADAQPFVVPCARLDPQAPRRWLKRGWQDLQRARRLSLTYGLVIALVSALVSWAAWNLGRFALLAGLLSGFVYVAPLVAAGLYSVSRSLEADFEPSFIRSVRLARHILGQAGVFALIQVVILLVWSRSGMMLNAFFPIEQGGTGVVLQFLGIGSLIGSVFAALTFASAAFSLPMIADREVDMVTACVSSINAVLRNKWVCLKWALYIVLLTGVGLATAFVGLIVVMPWLAYAAWHGYRETLDASRWPRLRSNPDVPGA
ncbi:MAG: DUF2189 domain-containing protein [Pseudomonadota bacterium]